MIYEHKKHKCNFYIKIAEAIECTNMRVNENVVIYTYKDSWFNVIRIKLIKLLLPKDIFIREAKEFDEKFIKIEN